MPARRVEFLVIVGEGLGHRLRLDGHRGGQQFLHALVMPALMRCLHQPPGALPCVKSVQVHVVPTRW